MRKQGPIDRRNPTQVRTIEEWDEFLYCRVPDIRDHRWVEDLEPGLTSSKCEVRSVDLLYLTADYMYTLLRLHEIDALPVEVRCRMNRVLAALYSDRTPHPTGHR
jgi:hypothetical protein